VLALSRLLPSDTVFLHDDTAVAILLEYGSLGSHAALFTREMGIPCLSGIRAIETTLTEKSVAQVDADRGFVIINPRTKELTSFKKKVATSEAFFQDALTRSQRTAVTLDGVKISVMANVGNIQDTNKAIINGADGIGLYRMEHIYLGRATPPNVNELYDEMRLTLVAARDFPICVRLLDVGADKPLPFLGFLAESNPALGQRGIRLLRAFPDLLDTQLLALLKLSDEFSLPCGIGFRLKLPTIAGLFQ